MPEAPLAFLWELERDFAQLVGRSPEGKGKKKKRHVRIGMKIGNQNTERKQTTCRGHRGKKPNQEQTSSTTWQLL